MPRVIQFPPHEPFVGTTTPGPGLGGVHRRGRPGDGAREARSAGDARGPSGAARERRADVERRRHHWLAGLSALAASVLAAAAWWLAGSRTVARNEPDPGRGTRDRAASAPQDPADSVVTSGGSVPRAMTNVEAGRVLPNGPRMLAARPLLDAIETGLVRAATVPRAKSFAAPLVVPAAIRLNAANVPAATAPSDEATTDPGPYGVTSPDQKKAGHEVWTSRGFQGVFNPGSARRARPRRRRRRRTNRAPPPPF